MNYFQTDERSIGEGKEGQQTVAIGSVKSEVCTKLQKMVENETIEDKKVLGFLVAEGHAQAIDWKPTLQEGCTECAKLQKLVENGTIKDTKVIGFLVEGGHAETIHWKATLQEGCSAVFDRYKAEEDFAGELKRVEVIAIKRWQLKKHTESLEEDATGLNDKPDEEIEETYDIVFQSVSL